MNLYSFRKAGSAAFAAALFVFGSTAAAQTPIGGDIKPRALRIAERNNLYCAGYVTTSSIDTADKVVGGWNEQDGWMYSQNNFVYLSLSAAGGAKPGDMFSIVRPRGQVNTKWTRKGNLGMYVQEVGSVEVVRVKSDHVVARVHTSCDNFHLGDLVRPLETRVSPMHVERPALDVFGDSSGKAMGRLFMARDNREALSKENIVYIDLGADDNAKVGDYVTVFRPLGKGNPFDREINESVEAHVGDYGSFKYQGGGFSNQTVRKSGENARGKVVTTDKAKSGRPELRKVVGELVILDVREKTATAVIVRNAQEIHTGDWVEIQ